MKHPGLSVRLDEVVEFIRGIRPTRYPDNVGFVDIDPRPNQVAEMVRKEFEGRVRAKFSGPVSEEQMEWAREAVERLGLKDG